MEACWEPCEAPGAGPCWDKECRKALREWAELGDSYRALQGEWFWLQWAGTFKGSAASFSGGGRKFKLTRGDEQRNSTDAALVEAVRAMLCAGEKERNRLLGLALRAAKSSGWRAVVSWDEGPEPGGWIQDKEFLRNGVLTTLSSIFMADFCKEDYRKVCVC